MVSLDARTGRIVGKFQATPGDVWNATGNAAAGPDYDFGASPQLFTTPEGKQVVGEGQKSGTYWAVDRGSMQPVWNTMIGPGSQVGGIIGSTATDGQRVYGPNTPVGEQWALGTDGSYKWISADGGPLKFGSTAVANGVVYTVDMNGFLLARDSSSGLVLARIPLGNPSWGGVSVAGGTVFVATGTQGGAGYIAAYRVRTGLDETNGVEHFEDRPEDDPDEYLAAQQRAEKCATAKRKYKKAKKAKSRSGMRKAKRSTRKYCGGTDSSAEHGGV